MSWQAQTTAVIVLLGYLVFLFLVAALAERYRRQLEASRVRTAVYVLAASVYCTAWTFYGSVGLASNRGLEFLTIYLGPALIALTWPVLLRKLVRVAKEQRITSISDFIASRYGKSAPLGTLVAILVVLGMIPYLGLQLKAVSVSFKLLVHAESVLTVFDPTIVVAAILALFGILFGARNLDFTKRQTGLMSAVAVESVVKLLAYLTVGAFVTWGVFGGFGDIFARIAAHPEWSRLLVLDSPVSASYARWSAMLLISMLAVMLLPRQFHVLVVQNADERDVNTVSWAFPLYLLLINIFVLPIAFAGLLVLQGSGVAADSFILALPLHFGSGFVSMLVFLGGFSAATAMIVVDSLALSKMLTNDVVLPLLLRRRGTRDIFLSTLFSTRVAILIVVGLGLAWAWIERGQLLLVEMGLLSFVAVSQCAPAILLGLYWRRGTRQGTYAGLISGFALWFYTLIIPSLQREGIVSASMLADGPFGFGVLRPTALLGLAGLDTLTHGVFWSLLVNTGAYVLVSALTQQDADDRAQAAAFVGVRLEGEPSGPPAILPPSEIERLIRQFVGEEEAAEIAHALYGGKAPEALSVPELLEVRIRLERLLAASLGAAAARFIVEERLTISKGEAQALVDSFLQMQQSLRSSERLLASVVQSVDDCIFTTDVRGRLLAVNPAGQRLLGYSEPEALGLGYADLIDPSDRRRVTAEIGQALRAGQGWRGTTTGLTRGGATFPAHLAISCVFDASGGLVGAVGVLRDLTEQVETQRRLIERETLASIGEMAAGVAHEIRNPLGGIKMATRLLSSSALNGGALSEEMARSILSGIAEIEAIINSLLDYTRETRLERQEYRLADIVESVVAAVEPEARQRQVTVVCGRVDRDLVASVDGQKLRQVLTNVLGNAVDATERRPDGRVEVRLYGRDGAAVVEVADNGVGMGPEVRDKIFVPFYTTKPSGTGLGMAIVKKIVDLHGGDIEIESAPGAGTRLRIVIPVLGTVAHAAPALPERATGADR